MSASEPRVQGADTYLRRRAACVVHLRKLLVSSDTVVPLRLFVKHFATHNRPPFVYI